jgi:MscS family membrane protein
MRARPWAALALLAALSTAATAQIPGLTSPASPATNEPRDPLGRSSPRGTIVGFSRAAARDDSFAAARYLQLEDDQKPNSARLTASLKALMDRDLHERLPEISDLPDGALDDGLDENLEHIGPLDIAGVKTFIKLVRVKDPETGLVWLISSETLRQIPADVGAADRSWVERHMPASLVKRSLFGLSLAHWSLLLGLLLGTAVLLWVLDAAIAFVASRLVRDAQRRHAWDTWNQATRLPAIIALTVIVQFFAIPPLGFPLSFRYVYARVGLVALAIAFAWLLKRVLALAFKQARSMVRGKDRASTQSLMMLAERLVQALIIVITIVVVLILVGVESKTALAGLGFLGVALALGAQKTVENLLGGIFMLSDKALAVGDYCTISNQSGWIEDVTLRSVRLRTVSQSLVSLPAGSLAQTGIENFATRRKIPVQCMLRLRYGTQVQQLQRILAGTRALLAKDSNFEKESASVRLVNFGTEAIELELFVYVLTSDADVHRAVREELLLTIATLVEEAGSALAPTRFIQVQGLAKADGDSAA